MALVILGVLSAVALPLYRSYVETSRQGVLVANITTLALFQEDHRLRTGGYLLTAADAAAITSVIGWRPGAGDDAAYSIADGGEGAYEVTATAPEGASVCLRLPARERC